MGFGGVWEGFGGSWRLLAHFWAAFFEACIQNALQKGSRRLLDSILTPCGTSEGFGRGLGRIFGGIWESLEGRK